MKHETEYMEGQFYFRDATLLSLRQLQEGLLLTLKGVCVEPTCPENPFLHAMRTKEMEIRLQDGALSGGKFFPSWTQAPSGKVTRAVSQYIFRENDLQDILEVLLHKGNFWISGGGTLPEVQFYLDLDLQTRRTGIDTDFARVEFSCKAIWTAWDAYCGMAPYEPRRR